ncbi:DoxX family protein, partial [uncultured Mucilaginibacter sp.]|uniref:DoxX family protein n=1 Tax=uncultured Mucilaginibacter sp. TaxID=797541 RepID=UPI0025D7D3E2
MTSKTITISYWILTILFSLAMLMDGIGGISHEKRGVERMQHLGYPLYVMTMFGAAKLLGVLAILQTTFNTIKEWAFSGFTISFVGAFWSRAYMGEGIGLLLPPVVILVV